MGDYFVAGQEKELAPGIAKTFGWTEVQVILNKK